MFITWNSPQNGKHNGTIACINGHVHFRDIPSEKQGSHDEAVRELSNALEQDPGNVAQVVSFLSMLGAKPYAMGDHQAFTALPDDWPSKVEAASAAVNGMPAPEPEPETLAELQAAHPDLVKSVEEGISSLKPIAEGSAAAEPGDGTKTPETGNEGQTNANSEGQGSSPSGSPDETKQEPEGGSEDTPK